MKQETFQKALQATARITCCASIFGLGCQADWIDTKAGITATDTGNETNEEESNNTDTSSTEDTSAPSDTSTTVDTGGQDTNDTQDTEIPDSGTETDPAYDEDCVDLIAGAFPDPSQWPDPQTIAQEVKDCCQLAAEYYDMTALQADGSFDWSVIDGWEYRDQCCNALEWQSDTMACTPWGPPMPPKFRTTKIHRPKRLQKILVRYA